MSASFAGPTICGQSYEYVNIERSGHLDTRKAVRCILGLAAEVLARDGEGESTAMK